VQYCANAAANRTGSEPGFLEEPEKPSRAVAMEPMVTAMCSQERKVRSLAKKVCRGGGEQKNGR
jgi:hypothetical protein